MKTNKIGDIPSNGTKVLCLYRVSSNKQLYYSDDHGVDIPMQRIRCREYAEAHGWKIVCELQEDGVSGYKVRAADRDQIQLIKEKTIRKEFDILLVFMFDRIGRIADETPFVVEWLVRNGIRVISVCEGEQKFETHTDLLLNYIRFWQADGESRKTAIRTANSLHILTEQGHFTGGACPYGYALVKTGRTNKKKHEVNDLVICEAEASVVRLMFSLAAYKGYGTQRIANYLHKSAILNRSGKNWHPATIRHILHNVLYTGVLRSGEVQSSPQPQLQIIEPDCFDRVQAIFGARSMPDRNIPLHTKSPSLLTGFLFCDSCGAHLQVNSSKSGKQKADGTDVIRKRYVCSTKRILHEPCEGQSTYVMERVDSIVEGRILDLFSKVKRLSRKNAIANYIHIQTEERESTIEGAKAMLQTIEQDCHALQQEIVKAISGKSAFSSATLESLLQKKNEERETYCAVLRNAELALAQMKEDSIKINREFDELMNMANNYLTCSIEAKHMIISDLVERIDLFRGYQLHIKLADYVERFLQRNRILW